LKTVSWANPVGATVTQGTASFTTQGPRLTIQTSDRSFINWQSFNIAPGETTSFLQPSSASLVWNQIHDQNASQILGNLNANGYVVLQNSAGFFIGGQAAISTHGLLLTTARIPVPDLFSGGAWDFNAPPPTASIINYGQINAGRRGSAFLLAHTIENHGSITAPEGQIGLYAGKEVLISQRPDGRGLSAKVELPDGSVDNSGKLIADAGTIALHAQVVNQGGLIQANSVRNVNGVIELVASDAVNLEATSTIQADGDTQGKSQGGSVTIKAGNQFSDRAGSAIDVAGGAQGGNGGAVEISAPQMSSIQSTVSGRALSGFKSGRLFIDPANILLTGSGDNAPDSGTVNPGDPPSAGSPDTLTLNVSSFNNLIQQNALSQISLQATRNIELNTYWALPDSQDPKASLTLTAGNNILLDDGAALAAGRNWSVNLFAGPANPTVKPAAGTAGIYLNGGTLGGSSIQTRNGDITLSAANDIRVQSNIDPSSSTPLANGIRTLDGGNIQATALFGDVTTGGNASGYLFQNHAPFHTVSDSLGGISTAAGGNVTLTAGGDVRSYLPTSQNADPGQDAGTGAFGAEPGDVTINAGGSVYGHYVVANGNGTISAKRNIGGAVLGDNVALSLTKGSWILKTDGSIFLQEVRNPNGTFNDTRPPRGSTGPNPTHLFDYDPHASVTLDAGNAVDLLTTPGNLPRGPFAVPALFPPSLYINAGPGGVFLADQVTLFPSAFGELEITTKGGGGLIGSAVNGNASDVVLLMSDSGAKNYSAATGAGSFSAEDHGSTPLELHNPNPVVLDISGNMENVKLVTVKETQVKVGGDLVNSAFSGQNLHSGDTTTIAVGGQIFNSPSFWSVLVQTRPTVLPAQDLPPNLPGLFDTILKLAVDPAAIARLVVPVNTSRQNVVNYWGSLLLFGTANNLTAGTGFAYDSASGKLSFLGQMSQRLITLLQQPTFTVVRFASDGYPMVDASGHLVTDTYTWVDRTSINDLIAGSAKTSTSVNDGLRIGGPGDFAIHAGSISLGDSFGILSVGALDYREGGLDRYANLAAITPIGAAIDVVADANIDLLTSTIAALGGGNVDIRSTGGQIDLGASGVLFSTRNLPLGAYVTGRGNISVEAFKNLNIDGSRIAAYDGGNVTVSSDTGNVDAGSGGTTAALVETHFVDPVTKKSGSYSAGVYGSGILAVTLVDPRQVPGGAAKPGDILVTTPEGNIFASRGGILQEALNGSVAGGPTVTLIAGTMPGDNNGHAPHPGNINLGDSGVIGGTVNLTANGNINGLVISRQNSTVNAAQSFSGAVLSGGSANVSAAAGTVSGTIVGIGGANVSGGSGVSAQVLGQNVSVNGGSSTSTLGTTAAATAASTSAAGTASTESRDKVIADSTQDDDLKKKKFGPSLVRRVGRVTVLLPSNP
jgi:filamentous hemagglutinin family protein